MSVTLASGMSGAWAEQYKAWFPFVRQAVLETVDQWGSAAAIHELAGTDLTDEMAGLQLRDWYQPFRSYLNRTGKLIRPVLVCLTARSLGADPVKVPSFVAMAEMIHSSSLVLDDIADDSDLRRGEPTAHRMVGVRTAGALGSSWLNMCFDILANSQAVLRDSSRRRLGRELAWEHWVTGLGTTIDTIWPSEGSMAHDPLEYLQSVVHRSTSYTYRMPFKIGASLADADDRVFSAYSKLGEEIGLAFQVIDDQLNVAPATEEWGKTTAEDITAGKVTLQVLLALRLADSKRAAELVRILRANTTDQSELQSAVDIMRECGALTEARAIADRHLDACLRIVSHMDFLHSDDRELWCSFISYLSNRDR
ncbi:MAG: polyprenyl synthetase family protein [Propionibacteriaceae bacterium]|nr:polyprenyl synthetase family protein [Propionibacteriaceae bacterium]